MFCNKYLLCSIKHLFCKNKIYKNFQNIQFLISNILLSTQTSPKKITVTWNEHSIHFQFLQSFSVKMDNLCTLIDFKVIKNSQLLMSKYFGSSGKSSSTLNCHNAKTEALLRYNPNMS